MVNWPAIGLIILPNVGGLAGGLITRPAIEKWYNQLKKPNWKPPNWVFGPVWTSLYCGMGYASYLVWIEGDWLQGWVIESILAEVNINKFSPLGGSSHIKLPYFIERKKAVVNVQNHDQCCFAWAITALLPANKHTSIVSSYPHFPTILNVDEPVRTALAVYGISLIANWCWTPIFFGAKNIQLALYEIQIINVTAAATTYLFYKINPYAGLLMLPYCAWLGMATALNYVIWRDNKDTKIKEIKDD